MSDITAVSLTDEEAASRLRSIANKIRHGTYHGVPAPVHPTNGQARVEWDNLKSTIRGLPDYLSRTRDYYLRILDSAPRFDAPRVRTPTLAAYPASDGRFHGRSSVAPGARESASRSASLRKSSSTMPVVEATSSRVRSLRSQLPRATGEMTTSRDQTWPAATEMGGHRDRTSMPVELRSSHGRGSDRLSRTPSTSTSRTHASRLLEPRRLSSRRSTPLELSPPATTRGGSPFRQPTPTVYAPTPRVPIDVASLSRAASRTSGEPTTRRSHSQASTRLPTPMVYTGPSPSLHPGQISTIPHDNAQNLPSSTYQSWATARRNIDDMNSRLPPRHQISPGTFTESADTYQAWADGVRKMEEANEYWPPGESRPRRRDQVYLTDDADIDNGLTEGEVDDMFPGERFVDPRRTSAPRLEMNERHREYLTERGGYLSEEEISEMFPGHGVIGYRPVFRKGGRGGDEVWGGL